MRIGIVNYGAGNIKSICNALDTLGYSGYSLVDDPDVLTKCEKIILPGVGAFGSGIAQLSERFLDQAILDSVKREVPLLGICLGMQFLASASEEFGSHKGLGIIPGIVKRIEFTAHPEGVRAKIPLIGWKKVYVTENADRFLPDFGDDYFYFVHSYQFIPESKSNLVGTYLEADEEIPAVVVLGNTIGVQFHPEKSGTRGLAFLKAFLEIE